MAPREGPASVLDVRQRDHPRPQARLRQAATPDGACRRAHPPACASGSRRCPATSAHRCGSTIPTSTSISTCAASPCPKPGTERQLLDLATLITADPFDRTRPLWQFVIVEGLKGNRAALIEKLHHTITDGEGGVQLSLEFLDFERDVPDLPIPTREEIDLANESADQGQPDSMRDFVAGTLRIPLGHRPSDQGSARRSRPDPRCELGCGRHVPRDRQPARRHREGQVTAVDRALAAPPSRGGQRTVHRNPCLGTQARRHAQHGVHDDRHRSRELLPRRARRAGRVAAGVDGDQHPHRRLRIERVLARAHAGADR